MSSYTKIKDNKILTEPRENIDEVELRKVICEGGSKLLVLRTGWEKHVGDKNQYFKNYPCITKTGAEFIVRSGIKMIASDLPSMDSMHTDYAAHRILLGSGVTIVEGLVNLKNAIGRDVFFFDFPLKIAKCDVSPVRALAVDTTDIFKQIK